MNDKKLVKIILESQHDQITRQTFEGEMFSKDQAIYVKYVEKVETQDIRHLIRYSANELKITRYGLIESEQTYRLNELRSGTYKNEMISLNVETMTHQLSVTDSFNHVVFGVPWVTPFHISFMYDLLVDGQVTGNFRIRLTIEEVK